MNNNLTLNFFLDKVEVIAKEGASVIIKFDGGRNKSNFYSVILSGGKLGDDFFRKDGSELILLLQDLINYYDNI